MSRINSAPPSGGSQKISSIGLDGHSVEAPYLDRDSFDENLPSYEVSEQNSSAPPPAYNGFDIESGDVDFYANDMKKPIPSTSFDESFKLENPQWNDKGFAVFFILIFVLFVGLCFHLGNELAKSGNNVMGSFKLDHSVWVFLSAMMAASLVLSFTGLAVMRATPTGFIKGGYFTNVAISVLGVLSGLPSGSVGVILFYSAVTALNIALYIRIRSKIPFSAVVLRVVSNTAKANVSTLVMAIVGSVLKAMVLFATLVSFVGAFSQWGPDEENVYKNKGLLIAACIFSLFASLYTTEVVKNVIHVTTAGVYGTWYYLSKSPLCPKDASSGALKRSLTYSFGSICFGSLVVSVIQLLTNMAYAGRQWAANNNSIVTYIGFWIFEVLLTVLETITKWFNEYAYSFVALYGQNFVRSARGTYQIVEQKGMTALIQNCLVSSALFIYSFIVGFFTAFSAIVYIVISEVEWVTPGESSFFTAVGIAFVIGFMTAQSCGNVVHSGSVTFFVALAKDPEVFQIGYPTEFDEIFSSYPEVLQKVYTTS